jgi:hypothetical protein
MAAALVRRDNGPAAAVFKYAQFSVTGKRFRISSQLII